MPAPTPTKRQIMLATEAKQQVTTTERFEDSDTRELTSGASIEHTGSGRVTMWRPEKRSDGSIFSWFPVEIAATNIQTNIDMGWLTECGDCGTQHEQANDGLPAWDYNACPLREQYATAYCPRCGRKFWDTETSAAQRKSDNKAVDLFTSETTPEARLRAQVTIHIANSHPSDLAVYGLIDPRPPAKYAG